MCVYIYIYIYTSCEARIETRCEPAEGGFGGAGASPGNLFFLMISMEMHTKEAPTKDIAFTTNKTKSFRDDVDLTYEFPCHFA